MIHTIQSDILFLKQEDVVQAGLLDMKQILEVTEKTYSLFGQGHIQNPPKLRTLIPDDEVHWKSFFNAMPAYIGGDVHICGIKWAAESKKNAFLPGIPYGIDIIILSDPETVLPFCILDGTLITAMRTSAVAGVFAKYTAPKDTHTATLVGAGVIGRTMLMALNEALPSLKTMYLSDLDLSKAQALAKEYQEEVKAEIIPTTDGKASAQKSELIVTQTTASEPFVDKSWIHKGVTLINMASNEVHLDVVEQMDGYFVDYWKQMVTYKGKALTQMAEKGTLSREDVTEISELILGKKPGREHAEQTLYCSSMGIGALDMMVAYQMYKNAVEKKLGTKVKLWDVPLWE